MAKAVFACKQIKEFPFKKFFTLLRFFFAKFSWLTKYLFMRDRPGYAGYRQCHYKKINDLIV